ncbi:MAG: GAF domain-containing sensor histidine kinase [Aureispira sp.]|nr:GAF domain-containing sensor histidine kinase [Aureispira sp.]
MSIKNIKQRNKELNILNTIAQTLNKTTVLQSALNQTLELTAQHLELDTGWIWMLPTDTKTPYLAASFNLPNIFMEQPSLLQGNCYCIDVYFSQKIKKAKAININEITCTRLKDLNKSSSQLRYHASVPLQHQEQVFGIFNVVSPKLQRLNNQQLQLLYTIADMLSVAIHRAQLFEQSKQLGIVEERNRLAREIHDTVAQGLSAIILKLETLDLLLPKTNTKEQMQKILNATTTLAKSNLTEIRNSVLDLRTTVLQENMLPTALKLLLAPSNLDNHFSILGEYKPLSKRLEMGVYRIAQEAINNSLQHAQATQLHLELKYSPTQLLLSIKDNGIGNVQMDISNQTHFGLIGMQERAKLLGGSFTISSLKDKGTTIQIIIPLLD